MKWKKDGTALKAMGLPFVMSEKCRIFCHQKVTIKWWPRGDLSIEWPPWQSGPRQSRRVERRTPRLVPRRQRRRWSRSASSPDFCSRRCLPRRNRHCTSHSRNVTLFTKSISLLFRLHSSSVLLSVCYSSAVAARLVFRYAAPLETTLFLGGAKSQQFSSRDDQKSDL